MNLVPGAVPKSRAGVGSNKSAPATSPTLLPKSSETCTVSCEYLHYVSHKIFFVKNRTCFEFCREEKPEEWMQISRYVSLLVACVCIFFSVIHVHGIIVIYRSST